jgi:hypothetical protein
VNASPRAVPADLALWLDLGCGAVGSCPGAVVTLAPYPESNSLWVEVFWTRTGSFTALNRPYPPGVLMWELLKEMAAREIDGRELSWEPDLDAEPTDRNPFAGRADR